MKDDEGLLEDMSEEDHELLEAGMEELRSAMARFREQLVVEPVFNIGSVTGLSDLAKLRFKLPKLNLASFEFGPTSSQLNMISAGFEEQFRKQWTAPSQEAQERARRLFSPPDLDIKESFRVELGLCRDNLVQSVTEIEAKWAPIDEERACELYVETDIDADEHGVRELFELAGLDVSSPRLRKKTFSELWPVLIKRLKEERTLDRLAEKIFQKQQAQQATVAAEAEQKSLSGPSPRTIDGGVAPGAGATNDTGTLTWKQKRVQLGERIPEQLLVLMTRDNSLRGMTSIEIAEVLECSPGAVRQTKTWKALQAEREQSRNALKGRDVINASEEN